MMKGNKNTMSPHTIRQCVIPAVLLILALMTPTACNESGGGGLLAGGGIGGTGISVGEISGFGSVIVNDVDFNTEKAEVVVNGNSIGVGDSTVRRALALGMVVRIEGKYRTDGSGTADRIVFTSNIKGPVQSITPIDSIVKILSLMGQSVIMDDRTRFEENTAFDLIAENNVLEISGWPDAGGEIRATYIGKISDTLEPGTEVMIKGIVTETNIAQRSLRINQLVIDISEITNPLPVVGQLVIVKGILDDNGILVASVLSIEDELGIEDADNVEIEGIVSQVSSPADFILGTTAVQTDEATSFKGLEPDDIVPGARLLVKGALTNRRLLADEVIARDKVNIEGKVAKVNDGLGEITLSGLSPLVIRVNSVTKIFGDASKLIDIQKGQHVKVLGYAAGEDKVEAAQVKVEKKARDKVKLQGPVTSKSNTTVSVFNVEIDMSQIDEFETDTEGSVSRDDFLNLATEGDTVSANGNLIGDVVEWKWIELLQE